MKHPVGGSIRWLVIGASLLLLTACGVGAVGEQIGASVEGTPTGTPTPSPLVVMASATPTPTIPLPEVPTTPPDEPPQAACPSGPESYGLQANHHFWTPTGLGDWVWQASGYLQVVLDENGKVSNTAAQTFTGSQSGQFSSGKNSCAFEAPAEVNVTLSGACVDGVLSLEIWEDWQMGTYKWVCDDDTFQFTLPDMMLPPSAHKVSYPLGDSSAYIYEIPFGGGSGSKIYTLVEE